MHSRLLITYYSLLITKNIMAEKRYYSISEVAEMIGEGVNLSTLRYWEKEFPFICPKKTDKKTRYYSQENIDAIKLVYHLLKEKGLTIEGARKKLKENKEGVVKNHEIILRLQGIQEEIQQIKEQFNAVLEDVRQEKE